MKKLLVTLVLIALVLAPLVVAKSTAYSSSLEVVNALITAGAPISPHHVINDTEATDLEYFKTDLDLLRVFDIASVLVYDETCFFYAT